jgi:hypothetical protein
VDKYRGYAQAARSLQLVPNPSPGCPQGYPQKYELSANSDNPVRLTLASGASAPYGLVVTERKAAMTRKPYQTETHIMRGGRLVPRPKPITLPLNDPIRRLR